MDSTPNTGQLPRPDYSGTPATVTYGRLVDQAGLSTQDLAYMLGVADATVRNRVTGRTPVSFEAISALRWLIHAKEEIG